MDHSPSSIVDGHIRPYFATPFGDMMIAGCFGLLAATAEVMPDLAETIYGSLRGERGRGVGARRRYAINRALELHRRALEYAGDRHLRHDPRL